MDKHAHKKEQFRLAPYLGAAAFFAAFVLGGALSFLSLDMGFAAFCVFALGGMVAIESVRRARWEQAADFKALHAKKKKVSFYAQAKALNASVLGVKQSLRIRNKPQAHKPPARKTIAPDVIRKAANTPSKAETAIIPFAKPDERNLPKESSDYSDDIVRELLSQAVRKNEIDVFIQPIVDLRNRAAAHFEIFSRIRAGRDFYLPADRYHEMAALDKRLGDIDAMLLEACFQMVRDTAVVAPISGKARLAGPSFFLNIGLHTLRDQVFYAPAFIGFERGTVTRRTDRI